MALFNPRMKFEIFVGQMTSFEVIKIVLSELYSLVAVTSSGILKAKQKLAVTFNSNKHGVIDFTKFSKMTMCRTSEAIS
jgi:hypothetical protein